MGDVEREKEKKLSESRTEVREGNERRGKEREKMRSD